MTKRDRFPARLRASWRRSERYGVSVDQVEPVFAGTPDTGSLLYECGYQVLAALHATLADEPVSLLLADREGQVLTRLCSDSAITRSLDRVHLAPGFRFTEREAGTNGLGLALADRAPSLVRGQEHYCTALQGYTCAAVPVLDPLTEEFVGTVNLTTWSTQSSGLLLALAQAAATGTSTLMLVRAGGRRERPAARGHVYRVPSDRLLDGESDPCGSRVWREAMQDARAATAAGRVLAVVGEPGAGKRALAALSRHGLSRRERVLSVRPPVPLEPDVPLEIESWLESWTPALGHDDSCVIISGVEDLPEWAVRRLAQCLAAARRDQALPQPFVITASEHGCIPEEVAAVVETVVEVPPLRLRTPDIVPLAEFFARGERHRHVAFTASAARALTACDWPQNVRQLRRVVRHAASRADVVDARHLPAEVFSGSGHRLSRLETLERDEIVRCLTEPGATVVHAAAALGISRATLYRKIALYDLTVPVRRS